MSFELSRSGPQDKRAKRERDAVRKESTMSSSQSPQANRGSAQDYERSSKGKSLDGIRPIRNDGGPENADPWKVKSDLSIESINGRADR